MKKAILLAAVASVAMCALPALASANVWHVDKTESFSGSGGAVNFFGSTQVDCTSTAINGAYETTTTGWIEFTFHGCLATTIFNPTCTTSGESSGTIKTTKLTFHNVMIGSTPGVLITPNHETGTFAHFSCFGLPVTIHGNGVLGTTSQFCGSKYSFMTVRLTTIAGSQGETSSTGSTYGLTSTTAGGSSVASALDFSGSVGFTFGERTIVCT